MRHQILGFHSQFTLREIKFMNWMSNKVNVLEYHEVFMFLNLPIEFHQCS